MMYARTHLPNPIKSAMEVMDLHIGCVSQAQNPGEQFIAIMLQPPDALLNEDKVGAILRNWSEVIEALEGLVDQATQAWGPMPSHMSYEQLLLRLGQLAGTLSRDDGRERLTHQLRSGHLKAAYVTLLRDLLTRALVESGREATP